MTASDLYQTPVALYRLVTVPDGLPVTLDEAKAQLGIRFPDDDDRILSYVKAAVRHLDGRTGALNRCLLTQTWAADFDYRFPQDVETGEFVIDIDLPPVTAITGITYLDTAGVSQTLATNQYTSLLNGDTARIVPAVGVCWPCTCSRARAVTVTFTAGYDDPASVPEPIKCAILLHVTHLYENRGIVSDTTGLSPMAYEGLLSTFTTISI